MDSVHFTSAKTGTGTDEWGTPDDLFVPLALAFDLTFDTCARAGMQKLPRFCTPEQDSLTMPWDFRNWCNPPYSDLKAWLAKGVAEWDEHQHQTLFLIPSRTDTRAWHLSGQRILTGSLPGAVLFLKGRVKFLGTDKHGNPCEDPAPFPSALVGIGPAFTLVGLLDALAGTRYV